MKLAALRFGAWGLGFGICAAPRMQVKPLIPHATVVSISNFAFNPAQLTVSKGDTIVWTNRDAFLHTVTADSAAWSSPELGMGKRFVLVATEVGRISYHCAAHPVMRGVIVVRE